MQEINSEIPSEIVNIDIPYWLITLKYRFFENIPHKNYQNLANSLRKIQINKTNFKDIKSSFIEFLTNSCNEFKNILSCDKLFKQLIESLETNNFAIALDIAVDMHKSTNRLIDRSTKYKEYAKGLSDILKKYH